MDEELHHTPLEPDRLPAGLATVFDEHRDVQVAAGGCPPRSRRSGKDHRERIGKAVTGETSRLVDGVRSHVGRVPGTLVNGDRIFRYPGVSIRTLTI
jgi:hypothetical protein